jgi:hypothetical protein
MAVYPLMRAGSKSIAQEIDLLPIGSPPETRSGTSGIGGLLMADSPALS